MPKMRAGDLPSAKMDPEGKQKWAQGRHPGNMIEKEENQRPSQLSVGSFFDPKLMKIPSNKLYKKNQQKLLNLMPTVSKLEPELDLKRTQ